MDERNFDVIVVGGGAAGLSGAVQLARQRRSVLVIDAGEPRNAPAAGVHGFLGHDGRAPHDLLAAGRAELDAYGGRLRSGHVDRVERTVDGFRISADGTDFRARRLLVASGVTDVLPEVDGLERHWGGSVVHCPYCHGWEVRDQAIAVLGGSWMSVHQAMLFGQLTDALSFVTHDLELDPEQRADLVAGGATIVEGHAESTVEDEAGRLIGLRVDGATLPCSTVAVAPRMVTHADFLAGLAIQPVELPRGMGTHLEADPQGQLAPGVWSAGNSSTPATQVVGAAAEGAMAGALINADLATEDVARAREAARTAA